MKKYLVVLAAFVMGIFALTNTAGAYNYGDYRSATLAAKAWDALEADDIEAVLAYTNKCLELYEGQAKKMQDSLTDYVEGDQQKTFSYWALNDVATCLYIQGEAYRKAEMREESKEAFTKLVNEFKFGQCWDKNGWFWKPAEAALEKLAMLESGLNLDFGDYSSSHLTGKAWEALRMKDLDLVLTYANKCLELYSAEAKKMQDSLTEYPWQTNEEIFSYWALNDVGTCLFIKGEAYTAAGKPDQAKKAYKQLVDDYYFAQCWDPQGWFWRVAKAAQGKLDDMAGL